MSYQPLFEKLNPSNLCLTVNQRLSRRLIAQYCQQQCERVIETPAIQALSDYIHQEYQQLQCVEALPMLLSTAQTLQLWQQIIADSESELALLNPIATAKTVHKAYRSLQQWCLTLHDINAETNEASYFIQWARLFEEQLQQRHAMTESQFIPMLKKPNFEQITLIGFDDIPPLMQQQFDSWQEQGCVISQFESPPRAKTYRSAAVSQLEVFYQAANWAKQVQQQDAKSKIAIVVPDLQAQREQIIDVFQEVLSPQQIQSADSALKQFSITGGQALSSYAPVSHALALWRSKHYFNRQDALTVLRSPYTIFNQQRQDHLPLALKPFPKQWQQFSDCDVDEQIKTTTQKISQISTQDERHLRDWIHCWQQQLQAVNWPGEVTLNSEEHQAISRFYNLLDELQTLSPVCGNLSYEQALNLLEQQLNETLFQAESEQQANIEILGVLEAGGLPFDQIFMTGMNHNQWPLTAKPNPYLPIDLQRDNGMPHASAARELEFAQSLLQQLSAHCNQLIASCALFEGDTVLKPSALIEEWPCADTITADGKLLHQQFLQSPGLQSQSDDRAPAIDSSDIEDLKSGVQIFKRQALCPFQAFTALRLQVEKWDWEEEPLNLAFRGQVLHRLLETVWGQLKDQKTLKNTSPEDLDKLVKDHTLDAIMKLKRYYPDAIPAYLQALEQARLSQLVLAWLNVEALRNDFQVLAEEQSMFGHIAGIPLKVRVDRIDQCGDDKLVLDYKTGYASRLNWYDDRPAEPQMPIYALLTGATGIAYAKVKVADMSIDGVGNSSITDGMFAVSEDRYTDQQSWSDLLQHWQQVFADLAQAFLSGDARVEPKSPEAACRQCDFKRLCRYHFKESSC